jgi:hypothetical protein
MTANTCTLCVHTEHDSRSVAEVVAQLATEQPPLLAWAEPNPLAVDVTNHTGRRDNFTPMQRGMPTWSTDLPLIEARLFWVDAAVHVVANEAGDCIWMRLVEKNAAADGLQMMRSEITVHTRSDWERFGIIKPDVLSGLRAIEYRERGRLVAWRLTIAEA